MLCCFQPWSDPKAAYDQQTSDGLSGFPGQRRTFVKTGGNALAAGPPQEINQQPQSPASNQPEALQTQQGNGDLVSVAVPADAVPGQTIHVKHPDGSGRLISAQIPAGMVPGSVFHVQAPSSNTAIASPAHVPAPLKPPSLPNQATPPMAHAEPLSACSNVPAVRPPAVPFSQCLDTPGDTPPAHQAHSYGAHDNRLTTAPTPSAPIALVQSNSGLSLLRVSVPPGAKPGSTILVQVPGENRKIAAQVPPNCSEFHVQYQPHTTKTSAPGSQSFLQQQQQQQQQCPPQAPPGQKLVKVRVPPGAMPGDMLHVQIPDEPGRLVQAQVPPGNVREFHVAYQPRIEHPGTQNHQPSTSYSNYNSNSNNWGADAALPLAGGLATAVAGAMIYDHFAHNNNGSSDFAS